jgi:hypothetical protein
MSDDPDPNPIDPLPDDAELIAYLDGELDADAERQIESKLAADPKARTSADEYRKTYELLDYLPRPEPSATFVSRTVTMVQPATISNQSTATASAAPSRPSWRDRLELFGWLVAVAAVGIGAYFLTPRTPPNPTDSGLTELDLQVIPKLPLYLGVDDVDFLRSLNKADLFDRSSLPSVESPPDQLRTNDLTRLIIQYRCLPPARRQQLQVLHQQLQDPHLPDREVLHRTLEEYAVWLDHLPDPEHQRILEAATNKRLDVVAEIHEMQWRESLSIHKRQAIRRAVGEERAELIALYREQERARRNEWELARRQWKELSVKGQAPWPFNDAELSRQVDAYIKNGFGVDPTAKFPTPDRDRKRELPPGCRLTLDELLDLRNKRDAAYQDGYWFSYGALLLRLSELHPTLPRPKTGEPIVRPEQLPNGHPGKRDGVVRGRQLIGKWPDYALEMSRMPRAEARFDPLGACRPDDFTEPIRQFISTTLTDADRKRLDRYLGKWPEYPQELIKLAREKNLSVPEVMLPGEPKKWQEFYQLQSGKK